MAELRLGLGLCAILLTAQRPRSGITRENFDRIQKGMTEAEIDGSHKPK